MPDFGWNASGGVLPHSSGVVRLEVTIFPSSVPLRKRTRQQYSYQFNTFTLGQILSNQLESLETVSDNSGHAIGITFKKLEKIYHTVCAIVPPGESIGDAVEIADSVFIVNQPSKSPYYVDRVGGKYYVDQGGDSFFPDPADRTKQAHQAFIATGSLFSSSFTTLDDAAIYARVDEEDVSNSDKFQFFASLIPSASTIKLSETITLAVGSEKDNNSQGEINKVAIADSDTISGNPNGSPSDLYSDSSESGFIPRGLYDPELFGVDQVGQTAIKSIQQFVAYVGINNVYLGSVIAGMLQANIDPSIENIGVNFSSGAKFVDKIQAYSNIPPGIHCSFIKALPIFPGEDFTVKFRKLSTDHPIAIVEDEDTGPLRWKMRRNYRYIDSGCFHASESGISTDNGIITSNYAVCPPSFADKQGKFDKQRLVSDTARQYYLADQPYVIVEIDGGIDNRYFLIIPQRGSIIMVEVTSDKEISDAVDEKGNLAKIISKSNISHSRVIHNFDIKGNALLGLDSFEIHFQHFRGLLQITFDPINKKQVITRKRYGNNVPINVFDSGLQDGLFIDDPRIKDHINTEIIPIKLSGAVIIHMGHVKMAFNFSAITYPSYATLSISYPTGITNLEGEHKAVNILFRSSGSFNEDENNDRDKFKDGKLLIKNEKGKVVPGQSSPHYSHAAGTIIETLGGELCAISASSFSDSQKLAITGPVGVNDLAWGAQYGDYSKPSRILASYRLTDIKEFVNRIHPYITLTSGDMTFASKFGTWLLNGVTRPICDGFSVFVPEGIKPAWEGIAADVTSNAMEFSDSWDRSDRTFLSHSGDIKFYLNKSDALPILENITAVQTDKGTLVGSVRKAEKTDSSNMSQMGANIGDQTAFLASLQDKYFYIEVRAWRDPYKTKSHQVGVSGAYGNTGPSYNPNAFHGTHKNGVPNSDNTIMLTGICRKSSFNIMDSHIEMSCKLEDYWSILDSMSWLNAPFYDAMRDYDAVMDVMQRAGFFYERGSRDPAYLIHKFVTSPSDSDYYEVPYDGTKVLANDYVLPGSYNTMNQPTFKPKTDEKYSSILKRFADISGKVIYFDRRGVMHFDVPPDEIEIMQLTASNSNKPLHQAPITDIFSHTYSSPSGSLVPWWNIIIGGYNFERGVQDIVNEIRIVSSTPDGTLVSAAHMNSASLSDIDLPGFIGFRKMFMQKSGYFGSGEAVRKQVERYTTMFNAPILAKFSILGRVGLHPNQTILVDGPGHSGAYRLLIQNISNTIKPKENSWEASLSGRYFIPGEKIKFTGTTLTLGAGSGGGN